MRRSRNKLTTEQQALAALQWRCGRTQRDIGVDYGYNPSSAGSSVCGAISNFLIEHLPAEHVQQSGLDARGYWHASQVIAFNTERRGLVDLALREYVRRGGKKLRIRLADCAQ